MENQQGLVHLYCGDGKGKTTAAIGLGVRAAGRGLRVLLFQFLKDSGTGELIPLQKLEVRVLPGVEKAVFTFRMTDAQKAESRRFHDHRLRECIDLCQRGEVDLLILDEAVGAYNKGLLDREMLLAFLDNRPQGLEVVLTGRDPAPELLSRADYITEMKKIRHPFEQGIPARLGIEK